MNGRIDRGPQQSCGKLTFLDWAGACGKPTSALCWKVVGNRDDGAPARESDEVSRTNDCRSDREGVFNNFSTGEGGFP